MNRPDPVEHLFAPGAARHLKKDNIRILLDHFVTARPGHHLDLVLVADAFDFAHKLDGVSGQISFDITKLGGRIVFAKNDQGCADADSAINILTIKPRTKRRMATPCSQKHYVQKSTPDRQTIGNFDGQRQTFM